MGPIYHYQPLDHSLSQIRIFTLLPSRDGASPIHGHLRIESFSPMPPTYEALSYVWGDLKHPSLVVGVDGKALGITLNLSRALIQLRRADRPRELWVDALCINQSSAEEKTQQVRKMHRIYSLASRVLIWLGKTEADSDHAMDCLDRITTSQLESFLGTNHEQRHRTVEYLLDIDLESIGALRKRAWWTRVWTLQEGLAANQDSLVLCGDRSALWTKLLMALQQEGSANQPGGPGSLRHPSTLDFVRVYHNRQACQPISLEDLIYASAQRKASDPRDHVYALLGLVKKSFYSPLEPDYTRSSTWAFQQVVVNITSTRRDLNFLLNIVLSHSRLGVIGTPSWSHDFHKQGNLVQCSEDYLERRYGTAYDGATTARPYSAMKHDAMKGTITLSGTIVGSVTASHCPELPNAGLTMNHQQAMTLHVEVLLYSMSTFTAAAAEAWRKRFAQDAVQAKVDAGNVWRVAANGRTFSEIISGTPARSFERVGDYELLARSSKADAQQLSCLANQSWSKDDDSDAEVVWSAYCKLCDFANTFHSEGCMFVTDSGYVGSGSKDIRCGDVVCVLFGCALPLVLRPQDDGTHKIISAVYVDGIMRGEFLENQMAYADVDFIIS
jgi:hypothetical protein